MKNSALKPTIFLMLITFICAYPLASKLRAQSLDNSEPSDTTIRPPFDGPIAPPPLFPPDETTADEITSNDSIVFEVASNDSIESPLGNEIAIIENLPTGLRNRILLQEFETSPDFEDSNEVSFAIRSVVTYIGDEGKVSISISTPSQAALDRNLILGDTEEGGISVTTDMPGELPNRITYMRGESIITIAGDIPSEELVQLLENVVVR
ncbi:MAG: hypothetical protein MJA27_24740 [Pseudanabaenales cyanobacterium]|nr:hypothetical protein [Pseudanabaenales cyanobacterium]